MTKPTVSTGGEKVEAQKFYNVGDKVRLVKANREGTIIQVDKDFPLPYQIDFGIFVSWFASDEIYLYSSAGGVDEKENS